MKNALLAFVIFFALANGGCSSSPPPLDDTQQQQATQLDEIAKKSGGDWSKLSDADKKSMIMIGGSETGAKMLLMGKAGKMGHHGLPGGPPPGP